MSMKGTDKECKEYVRRYKKLSWDQSLLGVAGFLGTISPGLLIVYLYKPDLFIGLDAFKLLLFSLALSMPVVFINILVCNSLRKVGVSNINVGIVALFLASIALYPSILVGYLFQLPFRDFLKVLLAMEVFTTGFMIWDGRADSDTNKKKC